MFKISLWFSAILATCNAELFEGDIKTFRHQLEQNYDTEVVDENFKQKYTGLYMMAPIGKWPSGIVPYVVDSDRFGEDIESTIQKFNKKVSPHVKLVKKTDDDYNYVNFQTTSSKYCWSYVGKIGGKQEIELGCFGKKVLPHVLEHEILHALGFWHEQSRHDRDDYVKINYENIIDGAESQFGKRHEVAPLEYDYKSVLHYNSKLFSKNGKPTIESISPKGVTLGNKKGITSMDLKKIIHAYTCDKIKRRRKCRRTKVCKWDRETKLCSGV